ncbi:hypothetical protein [Roseovarius sp.]|jgi:hypothetical protein
MLERIEMKMHVDMLRAASALARQRDVTVGQLVRDLLAREITRAHARPPIRADERLVAPLRARLEDDLAHAAGWEDLQARLQAKGYVLRASGGGLALHDWPGDRRICKASELGFSYARLMRRFGAPFPDHPHSHLIARHITQAGSAPHPQARTETGAPDGTPDTDIDVIEPC